MVSMLEHAGQTVAKVSISRLVAPEMNALICEQRVAYRGASGPDILEGRFEKSNDVLEEFKTPHLFWVRR